MGRRVQVAQVVQGGQWDVVFVERELCVPPLPIPPVLAPVLTVDGQVGPDASQWLAEVHARTAGTLTAQTYADSLAQFAAFLQRANTSLRGATRDHVIRYVNARTVESATRVSGSTWALDRAAIKQFYLWLRQTHGVALPFTLDTVTTPRRPVESMREDRGVAKAAAAGTPLRRSSRPSTSTAWRSPTTSSSRGTRSSSTRPRTGCTRSRPSWSPR